MLQSKATLADAISIRKWTTLKEGWVNKEIWEGFKRENLPSTVLMIYPENPNLPNREYIKVKVTIDE